MRHRYVAKVPLWSASSTPASALTAQGWALVVLDDALDLTTPGGRAMANMLATFAELERDLIATRTREALAARKARGEHTGRRTAIPAGVLRRIVLDRDRECLSFCRITFALEAEGVLSRTGLPRWHESTVRRAYASASASVLV